MQTIAEALGARSCNDIVDIDKYLRDKVDMENAMQGSLTGYNCKKCLNRGYTVELDEDMFEIHKACECMQIRKVMVNIQTSGLKDYIHSKTFETFKANTEWQKQIKQTALDFANNPSGWLFLSGQSGCGKTHLCTAVSAQLLNSGRRVSYVLWRDLLHRLYSKSKSFDASTYADELASVRDADVLYIDDFLKGSQNNADIDYAYEIINSRCYADRTTIISSELILDQLKAKDQAMAGRIYEKSRLHCFQCKKEESRNYRIGGSDGL